MCSSMLWTPNTSDMNDLRYKVWKQETAKSNIVSAPMLMYIPLTNHFTSFHQNVRRTHFQVCIWNSACESCPPASDQTVFGWTKDTSNLLLEPVMVSQSISLAPDYVLKLIRRSCKTCSHSKCPCSCAMLPCTVFCTCEGGLDCCGLYC